MKALTKASDSLTKEKYVFAQSLSYQTLKSRQFEDSRHGQEVSFESVKEINPDILFVNRTLAIGGDNSSNDGVLWVNALIARNTCR